MTVHRSINQEVRDLAADIHCGSPLAYDLLMLAGGDASLVREASSASPGAESMKAYIIDRRFKRIEK